MSEQKQDKKVYFITGGGTGGHIYPAMAVADGLIQSGNCEIYYIGNPNNMEYSIAKDKNFKFLPVNISGMPRKIGIELFLWGLKLIIAIFIALYYILKYKPTAIFGTGGYVSAPVLFASMYFTKTPYMLHDCDAQPGLVTRKLALKAKCVNLAFECAKTFINNANVTVFGNPIREDFKNCNKESAKDSLFLGKKLTVCIMGGSQGAQSINSAAINILKKLSENNIQVILQTGKKNYDKAITMLLKAYPEYQQDENVIVEPYFDNMSMILKASDIVVSRSGSLSLSEICASPAASILIPYPYAAADHQRKNAKFMQEKGASLYIEDNELTSELLFNRIMAIAKDETMLDKLTKNALSLANYDATQNIIETIKNIY